MIEESIWCIYAVDVGEKNEIWKLFNKQKQCNCI